MAPNASLPTLKPNRSASIGIGDRLALELLLGFTGMRRSGYALPWSANPGAILILIAAPFRIALSELLPEH
jgi:hypothetical protein